MSVYFARVKGYVKIGFSKDPSYRMQTLLSGGSKHPEDLSYGDWVDLLGTVPGDRKRERELHKEFEEHRVVGEWFIDHPDIEQAIWNDPFGRPFDHLPAGAEEAMDADPTVTRERAIQAAPLIRAEFMKTRNPLLDGVFGTHDEGARITDQMHRMNRDRRAAERAKHADVSKRSA